jgi:TM2 domain-containing membrane protein YozV
LNPICPYCRTEIGSLEGERVDCPGCGTPHHSDCFQENGGCTIFGCSKAPADDPKISVSGTDLAEVVNPAASVAPRPILGTGMFPAPAMEAPRDAVPASPPPLPPPTGTAPPPPPMGQVRNSSAPSALVDYYSANRPKTRVVFVLLGIFFGIFGVHNFYAGYVRKGVAQLCTTLFTCFYGAIVSWIWAIAEVCIVNKDADGVQFI